MGSALFLLSLLYISSMSVAFIMLALSRGQIFNPYSYQAHIPVGLPGKAPVGEVCCCFEEVLIPYYIKQVEISWQ